MGKRAALVVAIETFHEAGPPLQWATADAHAFQKILLQQGYMPDQCLVWSGHRTTWAALMSQMRRLTPQWHDVTQLLILWIDRVFTHQGRTWLACTDTLRDDPIGTALPWAEVASWIDKIAPAATTVWLCDFSPLPLDSADCSPGWNEAELAAAATPKRIIMTAAAGQEESLTSASLQHGLWRYHLLEALRGHSREALDAKGRLTAQGLHQYMAQAVPRTLRKTHEGRPQQTPLCFGLSSPDAPRGTDVILAEFAPHSHPSFDWFDPARLKRVVFRSEQVARVKELSGFRKSHSVPERANDWARRFVHRIGAADLKIDLDNVYERIREHFGYKRKDIETNCDEPGFGVIRTPDFEYSVWLDVDINNPTQVIWKREVGQWTSVDIVRQAAFQAVFGDKVDRLVFEFVKPLDVSAFVDRFEAETLPGSRIHIDSEGTSAEITLTGFAGRVWLTTLSATITGRPGDPTTLLDQFLGFLHKHLHRHNKQE